MTLYAINNVSLKEGPVTQLTKRYSAPLGYTNCGEEWLSD
jgi:hypothetical protein